MQPKTAAERKAVASFLGWLAMYTSWSREGEARAIAVRDWCEKNRHQSKKSS